MNRSVKTFIFVSQAVTNVLNSQTFSENSRKGAKVRENALKESLKLDNQFLEPDTQLLKKKDCKIWDWLF